MGDARWVPLPEAVRLLRTTESTLRRWIREGKVQAEAQPRAPRGARIVYRVLVTYVPEDPAPSAADSESEQPPAAAELISAAIAPYVDLNERLRAAHAGQAERIAELERDNSRLSAERDAARAEVEELEEALVKAEAARAMLSDALSRVLAEEREHAARPWWRRLFD